MKPTSADGQNKSTETQWPSVLKIASADEFRQSFAVAQLAVKLWQLKIAQSKIPLEKENLDPENFLDEAWKLIKSARDRVLREQTDAEYLATQGGSHEAAEAVVGRITRSRISFNRLCNSKPNQDTSKSIEIHGADGKINVDWKLYTTERAFDNLFWDYWNAISEIKDEGERKQYGQSLLTSWKRDGVPPNDFLALARFRRERDDRAENLKKKPKSKRKRLSPKARA